MYPRINPSFSFHRDASGGRLCIAIGATQTSRGLDDYAADPNGGFVATTYFAIDGYYVDVLAAADGTHTVDEIVDIYVAATDSFFGDALSRQALDWAESLPGFLQWFEQPLPSPQPPRITGTADAYYPQHAVIEITDRCNFACEHCYIAARPDAGSFMPFDVFSTVVERLGSNGVQVVELSGGECTMHPEFPRMLDLACARFSLVCVLTNGYLLGAPGRVRDAVLAHENVAVQVSIDGVQATHDAFRKHPHAFERAVAAIETCNAAHKPTRIASSITEQTLQEVPALVQLGRELAPALHAFSPVAPIGRGCNVTDSALASAEITRELERALVAAKVDAPAISQTGIPAIAGGVEQIRNCGAGHRTVAVGVDANVRPCNFGDNLGQLGNLVTDDYHDIFGSRRSFQLANAPRPGGLDCIGCELRKFCQGCPSKALSVARRKDVTCAWYDHWFGEPDGEDHAPRVLPLVDGEDLLGVCDSCSDAQRCC